MIFVFDTPAFLMGLAGRIAKKDVIIYTTPGVVNEIRNKWSMEMVNALVSSSLIKIVEPSDESINKVKNAHKKLGGKGITKTDLEVIALALELDRDSTIVFTNDYAIQNMLAFFGIKFASIGFRGIREVWKWSKRCPACKTYYTYEKNYCEICGTELKPIKKRISVIRNGT
ncbi:MAG: NOB1 family endonuclease [Thermoprotei archaeon]